MANETKKKNTLFTVNVPKVDLVEGYGSEPVEIQNPLSTIGQKYEDFKTSLAYPSTQPEEPSMVSGLGEKIRTGLQNLTRPQSPEESLYKYGYPGAKPVTPMQKAESFVTSDIPNYLRSGFQSLVGQQPQAAPQTTQTAPEGSSFLKDAGKALAYGLLGAGMGYGGASPSQIYGTFQAGKEAYELDNPESSTSQQYTNLVKNYSRLLGIPEETYLKTGSQLTARSLAPAVKELSDMYGMKEKERMMRIGQGNVMNRADYNFARTQAFKTAKDIAESKQSFNSMNTYMDTMINILTKPQAGTDQPRTPSSFRRGEIGEYVGGLGELGKTLRTAFPGTFSDVDVTAFNNARNQLAYSVARMFDKGALSNQDINIKLKNLTDASDPNAKEKLAEIKAMINEDLARNLGEKYDQFNYLRDLTGIEVPIPEATSTVGKAKVESGLFGKN